MASLLWRSSAKTSRKRPFTSAVSRTRKSVSAIRMTQRMRMVTSRVYLFSQISASARFNTPSRIQKDFFSPLNSCRLPLLLRHAQLSETCVRKVWYSRAPPLLATPWADSLLLLLLQISRQTFLVDIVFYHSLTMQHAVERDEQG